MYLIINNIIYLVYTEVFKLYNKSHNNKNEK